jgi:hypothetical protein
LGITKGRTIYDYWPHFRSIAVNVSLDGIHDVYNYIRGNGDFNQVEENIKEIKKIPNVSRVVGAFTAQAGNILQAAECIDYFINKMDIIFYSHRVSYPNCLSAQVLPNDLKATAITRLLAVKSQIDEWGAIKNNSLIGKVTHQQIQDNINYLQAKDQHNLWQDFLSFNYALDSGRNQSLLTVIPEFKPYV